MPPIQETPAFLLRSTGNCPLDFLLLLSSFPSPTKYLHHLSSAMVTPTKLFSSPKSLPLPLGLKENPSPSAPNSIGSSVKKPAFQEVPLFLSPSPPNQIQNSCPALLRPSSTYLSPTPPFASPRPPRTTQSTSISFNLPDPSANLPFFLIPVTGSMNSLPQNSVLRGMDSTSSCPSRKKLTSLLSSPVCFLPISHGTPLDTVPSRFLFLSHPSLPLLQPPTPASPSPCSSLSLADSS